MAGGDWAAPRKLDVSDPFPEPTTRDDRRVAALRAAPSTARAIVRAAMDEAPFAGRTLHFIGIGGAGMSGLALVARELGASVSGSDRADSPTLERLRAAGSTRPSATTR